MMKSENGGRDEVLMVEHLLGSTESVNSRAPTFIGQSQMVSGGIFQWVKCAKQSTARLESVENNIFGLAQETHVFRSDRRRRNGWPPTADYSRTMTCRSEFLDPCI